MHRPVHLLPIAAVIAVVLLCCAGIAAYLGWIAAPAANRGAPAPTPTQAVVALTAARCGRCGVIEAVRDVGASAGVAGSGSVTGAALGQQLAGFSKDMTNLVGLLLIALTGRAAGQEPGPSTIREVTVRFDDGSRRVLTEVSPATRRPGDRVKVVNGRIQPSEEMASGG